MPEFAVRPIGPTICTYQKLPRMLSRSLPTLLLIAAAWPSASVRAQALTVQQPVFSNFSVNTTVLVPDRGGAFLGGVKRAGESRSVYGPWPLRVGSSRGMFREASNMSAHVWIHDSEAMDRMLLNTPTNGFPPGGVVLQGNAGHAYSTLLSRHAGSTPPRSYPRSYPLSTIGDIIANQPNSEFERRAPAAPESRRPISGQPAIATVTQPAEGKSQRYYRLGLEAEQRGKVSLARLHYRMADKYGSTLARRKLDKLDTGKLAGR